MNTMQVSSLNNIQWVAVCDLDELVPGLGTTALINGRQIAVFRLLNHDIYALGNFDPISQAFVLSRGVLGDENGEPFIASPLYKNRFSLKTGACLDDEHYRVETFSTRVVNGRIQVAIAAEND